MKYYLGIDLGGTDIKVGVVDEKYNIIAKHVRPTFADRDAEDVIADMAAAGKAALESAGLSEKDILNVGVGIPGAVNSNTNTIVFAPNLKWKNFSFIPVFQKYWDIPVFIGNDADVAVLGEVYAGAAREYDSAVMLTLGTGVGGGIVFDKKLFKGGGGLGTEPGHIIINAGGELCMCGAKGCLEAYTSVTGLIREAIRIMEKYPDSMLNKMCNGDNSFINGKIIFDAAKEGDVAAKIIVSDYVKYLGAGIATFCNALRPEVILLGGGLCNAGALLFDPLSDIVDSLYFSPDGAGPPPILRAELGNDAGTIGAALLSIGL